MLFFGPGGQGKTQRCLKYREGSHYRSSQRGRFLRTSLPYRAAASPLFRNCHDGLLLNANGKESMANVLHRERELLVARRHYQAHTLVSVVTSLVRLMFDTPCAP